MAFIKNEVGALPNALSRDIEYKNHTSSIVVGVHIYADRDKVIQPEIKESNTKRNTYTPKQ